MNDDIKWMRALGILVHQQGGRAVISQTTLEEMRGINIEVRQDTETGNVIITTHASWSVYPDVTATGNAAETLQKVVK